MRRVVGTIAIAALAVAGTAVPAAAHDGDQRKCVSKHEWRHAKVGMKKARVHAIFDTPGRAWDGHAGGYTRTYRPCAWDGGTDVRLYVGYSGKTNRVVEKFIV
jgi:hypothetical protein